MHVAILTQYYPPEMGAPQARLSELARAFVRRGHAVTVLTALPNYPKGRIFPGYRTPLRRETMDGVRVIRAPLFPTQSAGMVPRLTSYFSFVFTSSMIGSLMLGRPDFLIVESPPLFLGLSARWLSWITGARLIFNVSDLWPASALHLGVVEADSFAYRVALRLEAACYQAAWLVTGQSKEIIADVSARFPDRQTYHLSNAVDTDAFRPEIGTVPARRVLGEDTKCIALYAGLHGLAQGLGQVLTAAEMVGPSVEVVMVGDGPEKSMLVERARSRGLRHVRFHEALPRHEMPATVASADIVLVPLRGHIPGAVPSKLYEAMACARPVILVADGEAERIVTRWEAGLVVRPGDTEGLATALTRLSNDQELRRRMGANGRRAVEAEFDRTAIGERFVRFLEEHR